MDPDVTLASAHPVLTVSDLPTALAYYRDRLGFDVLWQWGDPVVRAGVGGGGVELQLDFDPAGGRGPGEANVYVHVTGLDAYYRNCVERGVEVTDALAERPWGMKDFRVVDPDGNRLGFGEPL